jgi:hypothetical protein
MVDIFYRYGGGEDISDTNIFHRGNGTFSKQTGRTPDSNITSIMYSGYGSTFILNLGKFTFETFQATDMGKGQAGVLYT